MIGPSLRRELWTPGMIPKGEPANSQVDLSPSVCSRGSRGRIGRDSGYSQGRCSLSSTPNLAVGVWMLDRVSIALGSSAFCGIG